MLGDFYPALGRTVQPSRPFKVFHPPECEFVNSKACSVFLRPGGTAPLPKGVRKREQHNRAKLKLFDVTKSHMATMLFYITLLSVSVGATNVLVDFGKDHIVACPGDNVTIVWKGYHNLQEVDQSPSCSANHIGEEINPFKSSGHTETFHDIYAQPGQIRYFICTLHCDNAGITVSCPALVPNYTSPSSPPSPPVLSSPPNPPQSTSPLVSPPPDPPKTNPPSPPRPSPSASNRLPVSTWWIIGWLSIFPAGLGALLVVCAAGTSTLNLVRS